MFKTYIHESFLLFDQHYKQYKSKVNYYDQRLSYEVNKKFSQVILL